MLRDPDQEVMEKAYARWAPVYDVLCGPVFLNGRRAAASAARAVGGRILEIGVGTGLSFDDYDDTTEITGIDMSEPMIARARERRKKRALSLRQGTGGHGCARPQLFRTRRSTAWWPSSSSRWWKIPSVFCRNARACCAPGGQIILVNHLYSEHGLAAAVERLLAQKARKLGLRPEFPFQRLAAWAQNAWRRRAGRAAQAQAVRGLHAGALSTRGHAQSAAA